MVRKRIIYWLIALLALAALAVVLIFPEELFRSSVRLWLRAQGVQARTIEAGGYHIFYYEAGESRNPPVILVHGLGGNSLYTWMLLLPELAADFHVLAPDMLFGNLKAIAAEDYGLDREEELLLALMDAEDIERSDVIGLSVGGWVGLSLALDHPARVRRLALLAAAGLRPERLSLQGMGLDPAMSMGEFYDVLFHDPPPIPGFVLKMQTRRMGELLERLKLTLKAVRRNAVPLQPRLAKLKVPTLLVWGDNDRIIPPAEGEAFLELIPDARLEILERSGHAMVWDRPDALAESLIRFLKAP